MQGAGTGAVPSPDSLPRKWPTQVREIVAVRSVDVDVILVVDVGVIGS